MCVCVCVSVRACVRACVRASILFVWIGGIKGRRCGVYIMGSVHYVWVYGRVYTDISYMDIWVDILYTIHTDAGAEVEPTFRIARTAIYLVHICYL